MRTDLRRVLAVALLGCVVASCGSGNEGSGETTAQAPSTTTSAAPVRLSTAEYQAQVAAMDQAVAPAVAVVQVAGSIADLNTARLALAQVLQAQGTKLDALNPPAAADTLNNSLSSALIGAGRQLQTVDVNAAPKPDSCGNPVDQVGYARENVNAGIRILAPHLKSLTDAGYPISAFTPGPSVAPPPGNRRGANGKVVQRAGPKGRGRLKVNNSDTGDVAISVVVGGNPSKPQATMYVQAGQNATLTGLSGTYEVYFKSGSDWDEGRRAFTRDCHFEKFDQSFDQKSDWEVSLAQSIGGNASTSTVPGY
jgi:hypothetical protein